MILWSQKGLAKLSYTCLCNTGIRDRYIFNVFQLCAIMNAIEIFKMPFKHKNHVATKGKYWLNCAFWRQAMPNTHPWLDQTSGLEQQLNTALMMFIYIGKYYFQSEVRLWVQHLHQMKRQLCNSSSLNALETYWPSIRIGYYSTCKLFCHCF